MKNNLTITNKNSKITLDKSRKLLNFTNNILNNNKIINKDFDYNLYVESASTSHGMVLITSDGKFMITATGVCINLFHIKSGKEVKIYKGHNLTINKLAVSNDCKYLVSVSDSHSRSASLIKLWNINSGECLWTIEEKTEVSIDIQITQNSKYIMYKSNSEYDIYNKSPIKVLNIKDGNRVNKLEHYDGYNISKFLISFDGKYLISQYHTTVTLWDIITGDKLKIFDIPRRNLIVSITLDGKSIISCSESSINLFDIDSGVKFKSINDKKIRSVKYSADGKYIAYASNGDYDSASTVKLWEISNKSNIKSFKGHDRNIQSISMTLDGKYIVSAGSSTIKVWNINNGDIIKTFETPHFSNISNKIFSITPNITTTYIP